MTKGQREKRVCVLPLLAALLTADPIKPGTSFIGLSCDRRDSGIWEGGQQAAAKPLAVNGIPRRIFPLPSYPSSGILHGHHRWADASSSLQGHSRET